MKSMKVHVITEKAPDGGYSCFVDEDFDGFGLAGYGDSAKEAIDDLHKSYQEIKELNSEEGKDTIALEFIYQYDMQSFFNYFSFLNISEVARISGLNPSLLRQYASGKTRASQRQYKIIKDTVKSLANQLALAEF